MAAESGIHLTFIFLEVRIREAACGCYLNKRVELRKPKMIKHAELATWQLAAFFIDNE